MLFKSWSNTDIEILLTEGESFYLTNTCSNYEMKNSYHFVISDQGSITILKDNKYYSISNNKGIIKVEELLNLKK